MGSQKLIEPLVMDSLEWKILTPEGLVNA